MRVSRLIRTFYGLFLVLSLVAGCQPQSHVAENPITIGTILPASLTEETKQIITLLGLDQVEVFELRKDDSYPFTVHLWVEVFESGIKQENPLDIGMTKFSSEQDPNQKNQFLFSYDFKQEHNSEERFLYLTASVFNSSGSSSTEGKVALSGKSSGRLASPLNSERKIGLNQPVTVLTVIEDEGNSMAYNETELQEYDESGQRPEALLQYERVILFRVQLESET